MEDKYNLYIANINKFEVENHVGNFEFRKVELWPLIRFKLFMKLFNNTSDISHKKSFLSRAKFLLFTLFHNRSKTINQLQKTKYLFLGSENARRAFKKGRAYHIFFDALIEKYKIENYAILELNNSFKKNQKYSDNITNIDSLMMKNWLVANILYFFTPTVSTQINKLVDSWKFENFLIKKSVIKKMLHLAYLEYKVNSRTFKSIVNKTNPKILFFTCSYCYWNNMAVQFFNKLHITTIELQHGVINNNHIGYIYPQKNFGDCVPSHFLVFGMKEYEILKDKLNSKIITEGNCYFQLIQSNDQFDKKDIGTTWPKLKNKKIILVTSQGLTGNYLINFFEKVSNLLSLEYAIVYRLHQNERSNYNINTYRNLLLKENVVVQIDDTISLPQMLKQAKVHTSVFSTVLEEAVAFSVPNIIIKYNGWKNAEYLINKKLALVASSPAEFIKLIERIETPPKNESDFFYTKESNALKKIL